LQKFSVVIPTWNEARLITALVQSLRSTPSVAEVIVADNDSDDHTADLAGAEGCIVVRGGRPGVGRNAGAAVAAEPLILFLDADVVIGPEAVEFISEIFLDNSVNLVICPLVPLSDRRLVRACYRTMDIYLRICNGVGLNQGVGSLIAVRKDAFERVRGFDERITAGEDAHFVGKVGRLVGGVRYSRQVRVAVSARRFDLESPVVFTLKVVLWAALRLCGLRISILPYKWAPYIPDTTQQPEA
jgi:glycosyltransferase involved in cell wall biosynthesis